MGRVRDVWRALTAKSAESDSLREWRTLAEFLGVDADERDSMSEATYYACLKTLSENVGKLPCKLLLCLR